MFFDNKKSIAYLYGFSATLIWGWLVVFTRMCVTTSLTSLELVSLRFLVSGIIMTPAFIRIMLNNKEIKLPMWKNLTFMVLTGFPRCFFTVFGFSLTPARNCVIYYAISGVTSFAITCLSLHKLMWNRMMPFLLLLACAIFAIYQKFGANLYDILGGLSFAFSGFMMAFYGYYVKTWRAPSALYPIVMANFLSMIFIPIVICWNIFEHGVFMRGEINCVAIFHVLYQGIASSVIALWFFSKATHYLGAYKASFFIILEPVLGTILSAIILKEYADISETIIMIMLSVSAIMGFRSKD